MGGNWWGDYDDLGIIAPIAPSCKKKRSSDWVIGGNNVAIREVFIQRILRL